MFSVILPWIIFFKHRNTILLLNIDLTLLILLNPFILKVFPLIILDSLHKQSDHLGIKTVLFPISM